MKTQIIQLEAHDDVISTRDKMGWGQTGRILLVLPKGEAILNRQLDLVLLQRHAASLGAQLALVSTNTEVRFHARHLRIATFENLKEAQRSSWRSGRRRRLRIKRKTPRPDLYKLRQEVAYHPPAWVGRQPVRLGFFALGVLSFLAVILYLLPAAQIRLSPQTEVQQTELIVSAGPEIDTVTLGGKLPTRVLAVIVEGRSSAATTGKTSVAEETSSGFVRFTNLTEHEVEIPRGLIVMTIAENLDDRIRFSTTQSGRVPAGPGTSLVLAVKALSPGKNSNVGAGRLVAIEGPLGLELSASNAVATSGGTDQQAPAPTGRDIQRLEDDLEQNLSLAALEELTTQLQPGDFPITSTLAVSNTLQRVFTPQITAGQPYPPAHELSLTLRIEYKMLVVSALDLQELGARVLDTTLGDQRLALPGTLEITHLSPPQPAASGEYHWEIQVTRIVEARLDLEAAKNLVLGRTPERASQRLLQSLPLDRPPEISPVPSWWPFLPALPMRIDVAVGSD